MQHIAHEIVFAGNAVTIDRNNPVALSEAKSCNRAPGRNVRNYKPVARTAIEPQPNIRATPVSAIPIPAHVAIATAIAVTVKIRPIATIRAISVRTISVGIAITIRPVTIQI
jgi:hypothetical protein